MQQRPRNHEPHHQTLDLETMDKLLLIWIACTGAVLHRKVHHASKRKPAVWKPPSIHMHTLFATHASTMLISPTHMSDANVVRFLSSTSGAANPLVYPTVEDTTIVLCVNPSDSRLKPQSVIFGCPSLSNNTLLGFKSPCTMDNPCRYAMPWWIGGNTQCHCSWTHTCTFTTGDRMDTRTRNTSNRIVAACVMDGRGCLLVHQVWKLPPPHHGVCTKLEWKQTNTAVVHRGNDAPTHIPCTSVRMDAFNKHSFNGDNARMPHSAWDQHLSPFIMTQLRV